MLLVCVSKMHKKYLACYIFLLILFFLIQLYKISFFFHWVFMESSNFDNKLFSFFQLLLVVHDDKNKISHRDSKPPFRLAFATNPTILVC